MPKDVSIAVEKYINKQGEEKTKYIKIVTPPSLPAWATPEGYQFIMEKKK